MQSDSEDDFVNNENIPPPAKKPKKSKNAWSEPVFFDSRKAFDTIKDSEGKLLFKSSKKVYCDLCPINPLYHNMVRTYFKCANNHCGCSVEQPDCLCVKCTAEMRSEACAETGRIRMCTIGEHAEECTSLRKQGLSINEKALVDSIKQQNKAPNFGPGKVRDAMMDRGVEKKDLPAVKKVQNYLNYQRTTNSTHHDIALFEAQLQKMQFKDATESHSAFVYGSCIKEDGAVSVGSGHANSHFNVSFTSRDLLGNVKKAQELNNENEWPMTYCMDFTFKTNLLGFYFGVMGVVDACRQFFLGALTLISHKFVEDYVTCIQDFKNVCLARGQFVLSPFYAMVDGEAAIMNAIRQIFTSLDSVLMCFFHVMKNCKEHLKGVPKPLRRKIVRKIRGLHMSTGAVEFQLRLAAFSNFLIHNNQAAFLDYFIATWVNGNHTAWRIFDTRPGVGNTNNSVESFNSHFKGEFLNQKKYALEDLVTIITQIIRYYSCKDQVFRTTVDPEAKHKQRAVSLGAINAVINNCYYPNPYKLQLNEDGTYTWTKGFPFPERLHRTYVVKISTNGEDFCRCPVFQKLCYCKHVLATMYKFGLVSKRLGRGKFKNHTNQAKGKRRRNTPALQRDLPAPVQEAPAVIANVPHLIINAANRNEVPAGWVDGSDVSESEDEP